MTTAIFGARIKLKNVANYTNFPPNPTHYNKEKRVKIYYKW